MGENYLIEQANNSKKRRDKAMIESSRPKLFDRPDLMTTIYPATPNENQVFVEGERLLAIGKQGDQIIPLLRENRVVGQITGDAVAALIDAVLSSELKVNYINVQITDVSSLSGVGRARIIQE